MIVGALTGSNAVERKAEEAGPGAQGNILNGGEPFIILFLSFVRCDSRPHHHLRPNVGMEDTNWQWSPG